MDILAYPVLAYYGTAIAVLCLYGLHRYWLVWDYIRLCRGAEPPKPSGRFDDLPRVTVQLPMFNEPEVAERVITAACSIDWPRDRLQVQVLDDSTDDTPRIARDCVRRLADQGHDVVHLHREDRTGYKAGALAAGLESATGEYVAVFDADFVPPREFLRETVHYFTDDGIGLVQTGWSHLNRDRSLLTRIQAMSLDAHFVVEQAARSAAGRWFNFNGTAGIWRRRCIDDAGGWNHDTLTEDTDISYRAQMRGWRFLFLPHVTCPAELPPTIGALMTQQHRWSKGLVQNAIKLLPRILRSDAPLATKLEAWYHLTSPAPYVFIFLLTLLALPGLFMTLPVYGMAAPLALGIGTACLLMGTMAACVYYLVGQGGQGRDMLRAVFYLPALMTVGIGISAMNTKAVLEAIFGQQTPFVRTPKFGQAAESKADPATKRRRRLWPRGTVELVLGLVMSAAVVLAVRSPFTLIGVPFLVLFAAGYLAVSVPQLLEAARARRPAPTPAPSPTSAL